MQLAGPWPRGSRTRTPISPSIAVDPCGDIPPHHRSPLSFCRYLHCASFRFFEEHIDTPLEGPQSIMESTNGIGRQRDVVLGLPCERDRTNSTKVRTRFIGDSLQPKAKLGSARNPGGEGCRYHEAETVVRMGQKPGAAGATPSPQPLERSAKLVPLWRPACSSSSVIYRASGTSGLFRILQAAVTPDFDRGDGIANRYSILRNALVDPLP
jgi:hypothetical protein